VSRWGTDLKGTEAEVEWYAGQLLDIYDNKTWFAMNSFINCLDKFCPRKLTEEAHMNPKIQAAFVKRNQLHAEANKRYAEANKLHAEGYKLHAEGYKRYAEGYKRYAEADKLHAEGNLHFAQAVIDTLGPRATIDWTSTTTVVVDGVEYTTEC
jgi:hypothetical protein